jgi:deazaflavin-dependent oxidoreductase (nitroreductase family)
MRLPEQLARFNRHVTNPIARVAAGRLPQFGIIEHVGRRSGKTYRTPLNVFRVPDGFAIFLTYGPGRDWQKNLEKSGGTLIHRGRNWKLTNPVQVTAAEAQKFLPPFAAGLLRRLGLEYVVRVRAEPVED